MTAGAPITFWFDFGSPYAWLAAEQIEAVAARCGRPVRWRAILLGVVFRETGAMPLTAQPPLRADYMQRDVAREARRLGLPWTRSMLPDGVSLPLARVFQALDLADPALAARFALTALRAGFGHGEELDTMAKAQAFAARLGPAAAAAAAKADSPEARAALRAATSEAIGLGVFGAPFILVDGEAFWGQDRLAQMETWLREGAW